MTASRATSRPCARPTCRGTAVHRYVMAGMAWYRCTCGLEFPESAGSTAA